jgi:5'-3' exonuclease
MVNFIEQEIKPHLTKDGDLYLLFDPLSLSDLGETKNFAVPLNDRKKILSDYKEGRDYHSMFFDSIELFRKYYIHRGDKIKLVYSDEYEADDYVEPLLEQFDKEWQFDSHSRHVALLSTDLDWARYIFKEGGRRVDLVNSSFQTPFSVDQFVELFQFKPTIAANVVYKALFGDKSDNIIGALFIKKARFSVNAKILARDYIQYVSKNELTLDDVIKEFKTANFMTINNKVDKTAFDMLYLTMNIVDLKTPIMEKFYTNIQVIRSALQGRSIKDFVHSNPEQVKTNEILHQSIFGIKFATQFGKI